MSARVVVKEQEIIDPFLVVLDGWTEEDYFRLAPESRICEFVHGEVIMHSPVMLPHDRCVRFLSEILAGFLRARGLGEVVGEPYTMRLMPNLDYEPDLFVVRTEHFAALTPRCLEGPADLVIEVVSTGTRTHDLKRKRADFEAHGVGEYWAVDHEQQQLHAFRRKGEKFEASEHVAGRLESSAVPGFWIDVAWLWQGPLPDPQACLREILGS